MTTKSTRAGITSILHGLEQYNHSLDDELPMEVDMNACSRHSWPSLQDAYNG